MAPMLHFDSELSPFKKSEGPTEAEIQEVVQRLVAERQKTHHVLKR